MTRTLPEGLKILAADKASGIATLRHIFGDGPEIRAVSTVGEAMRAIAQPTDLIICGIHFDESRMFEFLSLVQNKRHLTMAPIVIFRDLESELDPTFFKSLEISATVLGAVGFIDLFSLKQKNGIAAADQYFRDFILDLVLPG